MCYIKAHLFNKLHSIFILNVSFHNLIHNGTGNNVRPRHHVSFNKMKKIKKKNEDPKHDQTNVGNKNNWTICFFFFFFVSFLVEFAIKIPIKFTRYVDVEAISSLAEFFKISSSSECFVWAVLIVCLCVNRDKVVANHWQSATRFTFYLKISFHADFCNRYQVRSWSWSCCSIWEWIVGLWAIHVKISLSILNGFFEWTKQPNT